MIAAEVLRPEQVRAASWALATLLVAVLIAMAFSARYPIRDDLVFAPMEALIEWPFQQRERVDAAASALPLAPSSPRDIPASVAGEPGIAPTVSLARLRCATVGGRREHAALCAGLTRSETQGREIAIAPVEGVLTRGGQMRRAILNSVNSSARGYALGEAQSYADPREDPLFEEGTDPATAAMRPCPVGVEPRGTGANLTGRTCQQHR